MSVYASKTGFSDEALVGNSGELLFNSEPLSRRTAQANTWGGDSAH